MTNEERDATKIRTLNEKKKDQKTTPPTCLAYDPAVSNVFGLFFVCFCVTAPLLPSLTNENNACKRCVVVRSTTSGCVAGFFGSTSVVPKL